MLIKVHDGMDQPKPRSNSHLNGRFENMTITYYPELALFLQETNGDTGMLTVTYKPPEGERESLDISLEPETRDLEVLNVTLHQSPTKAYTMPDNINQWFSKCFGYPVVLAYLGPHRRAVLRTLSPNANQRKSTSCKSWLSSMTSSLSATILRAKSQEDGISFADVAAYLVVTEESLQEVSSRLHYGTEMDITKFRPNIVLSGAKAAYEEDYWGGITIKSDFQTVSDPVEIILTQNCARCVSINVDYSTGQAAAGEAGTVLKKLMRDRRVDKGAKYSPIFGRYGFLRSGDAGRKISVGDGVQVSKVNEERTTFGIIYNFRSYRETLM
ncbi:hypothetical protein MMC21_008236 [Puttea exsequens]|nr:hypothetical protein [Puttea exsequens]